MAEYIITDEQLDKLANKHERIIVLRSDCGDAFPVSMEGEILRGLVRCKDCRFAYNRAEQAKDYGVDTEPDYVCDLLCCIKVEPDGFCSWGERITANGGDSGAVR